MNRVMIHHFPSFHYSCLLVNRLRIAGHDGLHRRREERLTETLHGPTDVAVRDDAD